MAKVFGTEGRYLELQGGTRTVSGIDTFGFFVCVGPTAKSRANILNHSAARVAKFSVQAFSQWISFRLLPLNCLLGAVWSKTFES